jgi:hypothetical protein
MELMAQRISKEREQLPVLGWREWVSLPELGVTHIKAKVDTGARSSAIHAFDVEVFEQEGKQLVRFVLHPRQQNTKVTVKAQAEILEYRSVRSSTGHVTERPVIVTEVSLFGRQFPVELTLVNRDDMGFRMLLGRQALRHRFTVDPAASYLAKKSK